MCLMLKMELLLKEEWYHDAKPPSFATAAMEYSDSGEKRNCIQETVLQIPREERNTDAMMCYSKKREKFDSVVTVRDGKYRRTR